MNIRVKEVNRLNFDRVRGMTFVGASAVFRLPQ